MACPKAIYHAGALIGLPRGGRGALLTPPLAKVGGCEARTRRAAVGPIYALACRGFPRQRRIVQRALLHRRSALAVGPARGEAPARRRRSAPEAHHRASRLGISRGR